MKRILVFVTGALVVSVAVGFAVRDPVPPEIAFSLYTPSGLERASRVPLVVALHGCGQNAADFAAGTEFNGLAESEKFFVLYPEQSRSRNPLGCWSWFDPMNHRRDPVSEAAALMARINDLLEAEPRIDRARVFVAGLSAGAGMTNILASCYPETFTGAAIFAGIPFAAADTGWKAAQLMAGRLEFSAEVSARRAVECAGPDKQVVPVFVLHGKADTRVVPINAEHVKNQWLELLDLRDDGLRNQSSRLEKAGACAQDPGEMCDESYRLGDRVRVRMVLIPDLPHAWSGTRGLLPNTDKRGPAASSLIWDFFKGL